MAIEVLVSPTDVAAITGDNGVLAVPVAAALGTPLYIETSLFIPIADALAGAGVGVGAIVRPDHFRRRCQHPRIRDPHQTR